MSYSLKAMKKSRMGRKSNKNFMVWYLDAHCRRNGAIIAHFAPPCPGAAFVYSVMLKPRKSVMSTNLLYDLHCHSTASDGTLSPAALVAHACGRGVIGEG